MSSIKKRSSASSFCRLSACVYSAAALAGLTDALAVLLNATGQRVSETTNGNSDRLLSSAALRAPTPELQLSPSSPGTSSTGLLSESLG